MDGHSARVSSLAWNRSLLSSGGAPPTAPALAPAPALALALAPALALALARLTLTLTLTLTLAGGRDSLIVHHDVRIAEHRCGTLKGHAQEVCGLRLGLGLGLGLGLSLGSGLGLGWGEGWG